MYTDQIRYDPCRDYYEVLRVASYASQPELLRAYRRAVKEHHPDAGGDPSGRAVQAVYEAYAVLGDSYKRAHYNSSRNRYGRAPGRPGAREPRAERVEFRHWMRRAAAIMVSVVSGALLLIAVATGLRAARSPSLPHVEQRHANADALQADEPRHASFEFATPLDPSDTD